MTNHSWFINSKTIFDQSAVSKALGDIEDNWTVSERQINIVLLLIHGEPALLAVYWRGNSKSEYLFWRKYYHKYNLEKPQPLRESSISYFGDII
jgi:hypothetical protein